VGLALNLYLSDRDGDWIAAPSYEAAKVALAKAPTFDPQDHWRSSCAEGTELPMIGSYSYFPSLHDGSWWQWYYGLFQSEAVLMMSIFSADERPRRFVGNVPPLTLEYPKPTRILRLRADGSVIVKRIARYPNLMTWDALAFDR
jgi:hypothetical protein